MSVIHSSAQNCKNCYRCIRNCPVKAIAFSDSQAKITEDCIFCSECIKECPQHAMTVDSDIELVNSLLQSDARIVVSLAPSFVGYYEDPDLFVGKLHSLGFADVRETAEAAAVVAEHYYSEYQKKGQVITTACPVIVELVTRHYPALVDCLAPVDSPMITHAKMVKAVYPDAKVVFIGPCYAKKKEILDQPGFIDAVLTFDEIPFLRPSARVSNGRLPNGSLQKSVLTNSRLTDSASSMGELATTDEAWRHDWDDSLHVYQLEMDGHRSVESPLVARVFPVEGGVVETTFHRLGRPSTYKAVSGISLCQSVLSTLESRLHPFFLELNACSGGCINGPVSGKEIGFLEREDRIRQHSLSSPESRLPKPPLAAITRHFVDSHLSPLERTEQEIRDVLVQIGKHSVEDELNCGACGYRTCREKARAVLDGRAEVSMCMPFMQTRAESLSNVIIDNTPNGIMTIGEDRRIKEANHAACAFFDVRRCDIIDVHSSRLFTDDEIPLYPSGRFMEKVQFPKISRTAMVTVTYMTDASVYLVVITDLTASEEERERTQRLKEETIEMAQDVIDNQMRFSQEIASLLGETTAETKVTLTKLKQLILNE